MLWRDHADKGGAKNVVDSVENLATMQLEAGFGGENFPAQAHTWCIL